ncbi:choice-of-anchor D domain-containing protein [Lutimonas zeaxanthinifaciens]|uniref:choice-of-anchor D domain-containing protein n=1 Tax=Lutimonas zeaxanthinifaciens TaxID=3060215 RepID=UPI00265CBD95|nr:choice-of-anchor D domain-containing protein [Lutimonas sp. YSD2104]WKK66840.1 choice-of-anchor D domain-containing protein [Lutimonas sp. YSD2104]
MKRNLLSFMFLLGTLALFSQETITMTSTSSSASWQIDRVTYSGTTLDWEAVNGAIGTVTATENRPQLNFSDNLLNEVIDITITSDDLSSLTQLDLFYDVNDGGSQITNLNISEATNLTTLAARASNLSILDVSSNINLQRLFVTGNRQLDGENLNISSNTGLTGLWIYGSGIVSVDISNNTLLNDLRLYDARLTTSVLDNILIDLDSHGLSNGNLQIANQTTGETISSSALTAYNSLLSKGWSIDVDPPTVDPPAETISMTTTSNSSTWQIDRVTYVGSGLEWEATNSAIGTLNPPGNQPVFDFSDNVSNELINVIISSTELSGLTQLDLFYDLGDGGSQITSVDLSNASELSILYARNSSLNSLDVSSNTNLTRLYVTGNRQLDNQSLSVSSNTQLDRLWIYNSGINSVDISANTLLTDVRMANARLTTSVLDQILIDLDNHGLSNGIIEISNQTTGETLSVASLEAYFSLLSKGWSIDVDPPTVDPPAETISMTTTSNSSTWQIDRVTYVGSGLEWEATNSAIGTLNPPGNQPVFDFSDNVSNELINIIISSTELSGLTQLDLFYDLGDGGSQITSVDLSNASELSILYARNSSLNSLDVSSNTNLTRLYVTGNRQLDNQSLSVSSNTQLDRLWIYNSGINSVDISANTLLTDVRMANARLTTSVLDQILIDLDNHGLSNGIIEISNQTTGDELSFNSLVAYESLISKGWTIDVDAPAPAPGAEINIVNNGVSIPNGNTPDISDGTDFGQVEIGSPISQIFEIQNIGDLDLTINFAATTGTYFTQDPQFIFGEIISSGSSTSIEVTYTPLTSGIQTGTITINNTDPDESNYVINLSAEGVEAINDGIIDVQGGSPLTSIPGDLTNTPSFLDGTDFEEVEIGSSQINTFTIFNNGTTDLDISTIQIVPVDGFELVGTPFPVTLAPGGSTTFDVEFTPSQIGNSVAIVQISNSDPNLELFQFLISGDGVENIISGDIMITQYYEGTTESKWIEVVNRSESSIPAGTYVLALYNESAIANIDNLAPSEFESIPELAPGELVLFSNLAASLPLQANLGVPADEIIRTDVCNFDGNDVILISTTSDESCYANREDIMGTVPASSWGANLAWIRGGNSNEIPEVDFNINNWIELSPSGDVDVATGTTNVILGNQITGGTIWNGSWTNVAPDRTRNASIAAGYSATNGNVEAYNLTIEAGSDLNFNGGTTNSVVVYSDLTIEGSFIIGDQESLVMFDNNASIIGNITKLESSTFRNDIYDITYWSSPITNASIETVFTGVDPDRIWYYDQSQSTESEPPLDYEDPTSTYWNTWVVATGLMTPGFGYAAEGPLQTGTHDISFTGTPNNGLIQFDIYELPDDDIGNDYSLIGNPYPSAIDIRTFLITNSSIIWPEIYLWTHTTPLDGWDFVETDYAVRNISGGVGVAPGEDPTENIGSSQGFFVRGLEGGSGLLSFTNGMRMIDANDQFFKTSTSKSKAIAAKNDEMDRVWLNLTSNQGGFNQIMIAFTNMATDEGVEPGYDSRPFSESKPLLLYSTIAGEKYTIQSLGSFTQNESKVKIGFDANVAPRVLSIGIEKSEGKLSNSPIYLVDNVLKVTHDLQLSDYSFDQNETGEFKERFTLVFTDVDINGPSDIELSNDLKISNRVDELKIDSNVEVENIKVYDIFGRLLQEKNPNNKSFTIGTELIKSGTVLILESKLENGSIVRKKTIRY